MAIYRGSVIGLVLACVTLTSCVMRGPAASESGNARIVYTDWRTAPRHSSGLAPDAAIVIDEAIVQVYAARAFRWRRHFAVHPWIIYKRAGDVTYTRYEVVGWRGRDVVQRNYAVPDGLWYGAVPELLVDHRGPVAARLIDQIEAAIGKDYRPLSQPVGLSPTGSGMQVTLGGLLGVSMGWQEGIEFNLLGLHMGVDLNTPALRLPLVGRIGFREAAP